MLDEIEQESTRANERVFAHSVENWQPKCFEDLQPIGARLIADLIAGLTVGLVALPLAMAFGIASGVTPQAGIYTAIVGGFLVSLLGGSRIQIGGPTGAFVVIVAGIIAPHGLSGLLMVTMMAGVILLFLAVTGLGTAVKFIPRPVVIGFTNGIALLIASTQIKDFLGLRIAENPSEFFARMQAVVGRPANAGLDCRRRSRVGLAGVDPAGAAMAAEAARLDRGTVRRHVGRGRLSAAGGDHRIQVRGIPWRPAADPHPRVPRRSDPAAAAGGHDGGDAGRGRESALRGRRRLDDAAIGTIRTPSSWRKGWPTSSCRSSVAFPSPARSPARRRTSARARGRRSPGWFMR